MGGNGQSRGYPKLDKGGDNMGDWGQQRVTLGRQGVHGKPTASSYESRETGLLRLEGSWRVQTGKVGPESSEVDEHYQFTSPLVQPNVGTWDEKGGRAISKGKYP